MFCAFFAVRRTCAIAGLRSRRPDGPGDAPEQPGKSRLPADSFELDKKEQTQMRAHRLSPRTNRTRRRVASIAIGALAATSLAVTATTPAQATPYSNIYVSFPTWLANCPNGGKVTVINAAVGDLWATPPGGDGGDDLIYPKVNLNASNDISAQNFCSRPWYDGGGYWAPTVSATFEPTRGGQTFWIGPAGQTNN
jgi:hypothetical protein